MNDRRDLTKVGDLIDSVLGSVARRGVAPVVRLRQMWPEIAGEWAERSQPVAINHGVLAVEVASGMDASMLRYATGELLSRVQSELAGAPEITRISVRVRSASAGAK